MPALTQSVTLQDVFKVATSKYPPRNILLAGPPGVGKTTFCFLLADLLKKQAFKIQHHAEGSPPEAFGYYVPKEKSFEWMSGPLDLAYQTGGILIHDEIIEASGPMKTFLYGALDNGRGGEISYVGRTFKPEPGMMNLCTMNGWPYEGGIPEALLDRMDATFIITQPSPKQLLTLEPDLRELCGLAYANAKDPMLGPALTFRMFAALQKLRTVLPLEQAVLSACHGNMTLAGTFLEVLALSGDGDDDGLEDDEEEDDDDDE